MNEQLENLFKEHNGYLLANQVRGSSMRYHLNKMIASGEVQKVRHGLYFHLAYQQFDERTLVAEMIPNGVFCLFTAWQYFHLSTTVSHQYHIAIHRNTKINLPEYPPVALYYWSDKVYTLGITEIQIAGKAVKCYDKERSVCDAVKFRNKVGEEIMQEVLKAYMKTLDKNMDRLLEYAKILRIEKIILPYLKALI